MTRTSKVERTHNAAKKYLAARGAGNVDLRAFFTGVDDQNIAANLASITGAIARATAGKLAFDASAPELQKAMRAAISEPDGTSKGSEVDEDIIDRVLRLLESRLTPSELICVHDILMKPPKTKNYDPANLTAEDARNARLAYDARFPGAKHIVVEPSTSPVPQRQSQQPASPSDYFARFPDAKRIGF